MTRKAAVIAIAVFFTLGFPCYAELAPIAIESGIQAYQVIQCDAHGLAEVNCAGRVDAVASGTVETRVLSKKHKVKPWSAVGTVSDSKWNAHIAGLPVGGPYAIEFRAKDDTGKTRAETVVQEVLVGDLWILAGQSNMEGYADLVHTAEPSRQVHAFYMNDTWQIAKEPLHDLWSSCDHVHNSVSGEKSPAKGAGLGLPFALEMARRTGRPVGLIPCAHGNTSMTQWNPELKEPYGDSLYGSMYRRFLAVGGHIRGVLWHQGESETLSDEDVAAYPQRLSSLVRAIRTDFASPDLPFYYVQIGRTVHFAPIEPRRWNAIQQAQLDAEKLIPHVGMTASIDLPLDDFVHVSTDGHKVLGQRLAALVCRDLFGEASIQGGPRFSQMEMVKTPYALELHVRLQGVNGKLQAAGRVSGFSLSDAEGRDLPMIVEQSLSDEEPATVILRLTTPLGGCPEQVYLWYGHGLNPYCNVVDSQNLALPVFGPVPVLERIPF